MNWVDESFGSGCPTMTTYLPRPWNPAGGTLKTGKMFWILCHEHRLKARLLQHAVDPLHTLALSARRNRRVAA